MTGWAITYVCATASQTNPAELRAVHNCEDEDVDTGRRERNGRRPMNKCVSLHRVNMAMMLGTHQSVRMATRRMRGVLNFRFRRGHTKSEVRKTLTKL